MIEHKPTTLATVSPGVPALLQKDYYIKFSDAWPGQLGTITYTTPGTGDVVGKYFKVTKTNQITYDISYILPSGDYRDVDFGNINTGFNENLYPVNQHTLYEVMLGWKPANMLAFFFIPAGEHIARLEQAGMVPPNALPFPTTNMRYLGAKKPSDSPYEDKKLFFYFVKDLDAMIMRLFIDSGVVYDKVITGLLINKCYIEQVNKAEAAKSSKVKEILYYSEYRW